MPSILASVVAYSVVISIFGESTLFSHALRFPFVPEHLPLYGLLALLVAGMAAGFATMLRLSRRFFQALPLAGLGAPRARRTPARGVLYPDPRLAGTRSGLEGHGLGILGGGYGAVQMAISGADWLPAG